MTVNIEDIRIGGQAKFSIEGKDREWQTIIGIRKDTNEVAAIHVCGMGWDMEKFNKSSIFNHYDFDSTYLPCRLFTYGVSSIIEYKDAEKPTEKSLKTIESKRDRMTEFFFPKDKLNPERDANSPWEFL
jgi:hypothetical protein